MNDDNPKAETRYQKYLARKRQKQAMKPPKSQVTLSMALQMAQAASAPILECLVPVNLFETGIGNLVFARSLPDGRIALGVFLLDVFCLGIKNAFFSMVTRDEYDRRLRQRLVDEDLQRVEPACLRKLVEGGVVYARELGFTPHADYAMAHQIFGDVDSAMCTSYFNYGHEGKPLYISGPNETAAQVKAIVDHLHRRLGPGNFDYMVAVR
ncbi:MAG TPA: hypothetical protein VNW97_08265 [Candidatus Saccharimonadales bacterium]|jgi:hypothetical protein|nr:hypothetical protein [Candidatus Saccharimonadales bacterium]